MKLLKTLEIKMLSQSTHLQSSPTACNPGIGRWPPKIFTKVRIQQSFCGESSEVMNTGSAS